jgi:hypothetical protein
METVTINHTDKAETKYKIYPSGTAYHIETPAAVCEALENARATGQRLQIYYGDTKTGRNWNEENDTRGTICRSTGSVKVPLLIATSRSYGGGAILDHCIIKIKGRTGIIYQQGNYKQQTFEVVTSDLTGYSHNVLIDGKLYSRHKTERSAKLLVKKLQ